MRFAVVKFGGTSVATEKNRMQAVRQIRRLKEEGYEVAVVVSAMGRKGEPYATDTLLSLVSPASDLRAKDLLASCGEIISSCVLSDRLNQEGLTALPMNGSSAGIQTNGEFGNARICAVQTALVQKMMAAGRIPVITGFQGVSADGEVTTLGRGGSDTSAVEIGGCLHAEKVLIFTDVPGVAVADPRLIPEAAYLQKIGYRDMLLLAQWGAKVIHPRAVEAGRRHGVPVWVRSTFDENPGTEIADPSPNYQGLEGITALKHCRLNAAEATLQLPNCRLSPDAGGTVSVITALFRKIPQTELQKKYGAERVAIETVDENTFLFHKIVSDEAAPEQIRRIYRDWCRASQMPVWA